MVLSSVAATNPRWLAPEILSGKGYTFASDTYSFGIIMWELLTWQVPWHEIGPWQVVAMVTEGHKRPEVPPEEALPTPSFSGQADYVVLMQECWAQETEARPSFSTVISRLRGMLAREAQLLRARHGSPSKLRGGSGTAGAASSSSAALASCRAGSGALGEEVVSTLGSQPTLLHDSPSDSSSLYRSRRPQENGGGLDADNSLLPILPPPIPRLPSPRPSQAGASSSSHPPP